MEPGAQLARRADRLRAGRTPFVQATVVRVERPASARAGDRALILPDGTVEGFVGGTCAASTVRAQALRLLESGESTLLRITPEPEGPDDPDDPDEAAVPKDSDRAAVPEGPDTAAGAEAARRPSVEGMVSVANHCLSGGTLDVFLEAVIPPMLIQVFGDGPIARALAAVGAAAGYHVEFAAGPSEPGGADLSGPGSGGPSMPIPADSSGPGAAHPSEPGAAHPSGSSSAGSSSPGTAEPSGPINADAAAVVVATHGRDEEPLLTAALRAGVPYVGLIASVRRGAAVVNGLDGGGRIHTPAGLDIGARTAGEIALSVFAEIISNRPRPGRR
jgi:xanthine dehydrogenase accessory factor